MQSNTGKTNIASSLPYYYKFLIKRVNKGSLYKTVLNPFFGAEHVSYESISLIDALEILKTSRASSVKNFR